MFNKKILAFVVLIMLGTAIVPGSAASPNDDSVHVSRIVVEPNGPDLNFTVYYESSLFTKVFSIIFGARVVQPSIQDLFVNFTNVSIVSIDSNNGVAKLTAKGQSRLTDGGWYVYDGTASLPSNVDVIEVHTPDGNVMTLNNANKLPLITNRVTPIANGSSPIANGSKAT